MLAIIDIVVRRPDNVWVTDDAYDVAVLLMLVMTLHMT